MQDLNDLYYFAQVVTHGGFAAAARALREPKSKLSRRVAGLEERLGIRLIERSSRRFRVTDLGQAFYERCRQMIADAEEAEAIVADLRADPCGEVRLSCPTGMVEPLRPILTAYLARYPRVRLHVAVLNRRVDLIDERIDVALRVRTMLDSDASLTMRTLGRSRRILVASPSLPLPADALAGIEGLASAPTLSTATQPGEDAWDLVGPAGETINVRHQPRLVCEDFAAVRDAAEAGLGIALLPDHLCAGAIGAGRLVPLHSGWHAPEGLVHLVLTTRKGLRPSVRALIDHVAEAFAGDRAMLSEEARAAPRPSTSSG